MFSSVVNSISSGLNHLTEDAKSKKEKAEKLEAIQIGQMISIAVLVASVALAIVGISLTASLSSFIGGPILFVALAAGYLSYNAYKVSVNAKDVVENKLSYMKLLPVPEPSYDKEKVRAQLLKDTFCFEWAANFAENQLTPKYFE